MHILHALTHSVHGGGQAVPYQLVRHLQRRRPDVRNTVMLPEGGVYVDTFRETGASVVTFPLNTLAFRSAVTIRGTVRRIAPDIIHTHGRGAGLYLRTLPAGVTAARRVHSHHGFHLPEHWPHSTVFRIAEERFLQRTDAVIAVSESEREVILRTNPGSQPKVTVIRNIVDAGEVRRRALVPDSGAADILHEMERYPTVIMVGRDDPVKNHPLAFRAAATVLRESTEPRFVFVGITPAVPGFRSLSDDFPGRVHAAGLVANPLPFIAQSALLLMTSKREGSPLAVMEAAALGVPAVAVRTRGLDEAVRDGETGLLTGDKAEEVAAAVLRCLSDSRRLKRLSEGARAAADAWDLDAWMEKYLAVYAGATAC